MIFKVQVLDGKGFGQEAQTLVCCAAFGRTTKTTQYSVATDEHIWNSTLTWSVDKDELRSATSNTNHCKISVLRKDGTCLGWVVISLRSAKLQRQYKSNPDGLWLQLNATKLHDPPALRVVYSLQDERHLPSAQQRSSPLIMQHSDSSSSLSSRASTSSRGSDASGSSSGSDALALAHGNPAEGAAQPKESNPDDATAAANRLRSQPSRAASSAHRASFGASTADGEASAGAGAGVVAAEEAQAAEASADALEPAAAVAVEADVGMQDAAAGAMQPQVQVGGAAARAAAPATQDAAATQLLADASAPTLADAAAGDDAEDTTVAAADTAAAAGVNAALATSAVEQQQQGQLQLLKPQMQGLDGVGPAPTQAAAAAVEAAPPAAGINGSSSSHHQEAGPSEADALPALEAKLPSFAQRQQATQQQQQQPSLLPELQPQQALQAVQGLPGPPQEQLQIAQQQLGVAAVGAPAPEAAPRVPDAAAAASAAAVLPLPDPVRQFVFTLDLRSFQAGRRLPVTLGSIYVTAWMPQELTSFLAKDCDSKLPPRMAPLKTKPAVDIPRGSEGALPSGTASVSFTSGVMALAGLLASEPHITLEVWHKERLRSDLLLGVASLPLSTLLQECWVDGYAPVYALMTKASASAGSGSSRALQQQQQLPGAEEKVQVGLLRVVMSLQENGPAEPTGAAAASLSKAAGSPLSRNPSKQRQQKPANQPAAAADGKEPTGQGQQLAQQAVQPAAAAAAAVAAAAAGGGGGGVVSGPQGSGQLPEFLVAWELEVWRKAEEARFRAQLQELEQQRMGIIEASWRAREAQRQSQAAAMKAQYAGLEQSTRELLAATQERERALMAAEAELRLRKAALEREAAGRMTEAEAAVRRLQVECEHQLGIERERTAAASQQRDAAEARAAALEVQLTELVASQRSAPESQLKVQLAEALQAAKAAEAKLHAALKLKQKYKQQVQQLAREVAALHYKQQQDVLQQHQQQLAAALAREQQGLAAAHKTELATLRDELGRLRAAAAADAAAFAPCRNDVRAGAARLGADAGSPARSDGSRHRPARWHKHAHGSRREKEDQQWHAEHDSPAKQQQGQWQGDQQLQHAAVFQDNGSSGGGSVGGCSSGSASDGDSSSSSTDYIRLAAERSARETAAEVATLAAMLNPSLSRRSGISTAAAGDAEGATGAKAAVQQQQFNGAETSQQPAVAAVTVAASRQGPGGAAKASGAAAAGSNAGSSAAMAEVRRLLKEKAELLSTGLYGSGDAVIKQLDARVHSLAELAAAS